jgi:uncharacterized membrane protein YhaH (DUF805 family)
MFQNPFSFEGRIRRTEYCLSYLIYMASGYVMDLFIDGNFSTDIALIANLVLLVPIVWFMLAQGAKRCHDRDNSGWFQIIPFYILWMAFADSIPGTNEYGDNPKGIGNIDAIDRIGEHLTNQSV